MGFWLSDILENCCWCCGEEVVNVWGVFWECIYVSIIIGLWENEFGWCFGNKDFWRRLVYYKIEWWGGLYVFYWVRYCLCYGFRLRNFIFKERSLFWWSCVCNKEFVFCFCVCGWWWSEVCVFECRCVWEVFRIMYGYYEMKYCILWGIMESFGFGFLIGDVLKNIF